MRYRTLDTRTWGDARFRALSAPGPSGQVLWLYLLLGPHVTALPGLFVAGEMALAEALGWPIAGLRKCFGELHQQGMAKADWRCRVVYLPNAIKYNPPQNRNQLVGWRKLWDEIPECPLKVEAWQSFKSYVDTCCTIRQVFAELFGEPLAKPFGEPLSSTGLVNIENPGTGSGTGSGTGGGVAAPLSAGKPAVRATTSAPTEGFDAFWSAYPRKVAKQAALKAWSKLNPGPELLAAILAAIERHKRDVPAWRSGDVQYIPHPATWLNGRRWEDQAGGGRTMFGGIKEWLDRETGVANDA